MKSCPRPIAIALVASLLAIAVPAAAQPAADADWVTGYHHAGVQGTVSAMLSRPGEVFVGGSILAVGDVPVRNVARLVTTDGVVTGWSALGDGFDGSVKALAEHDGQVVAAGFFRHSGGRRRNWSASRAGTAPRGSRSARGCPARAWLPGKLWRRPVCRRLALGPGTPGATPCRPMARCGR